MKENQNFCNPAGARVDNSGSTFTPGLTQDCVASGFKTQSESGGTLNIPIFAFSFASYILTPDVCGKDKRVRMFVNGYAPPTSCDAASQLVQALGLACELQNRRAAS